MSHKQIYSGALVILISMTMLSLGENVRAGVDIMGNQTGYEDPSAAEPDPLEGLGKSCRKRRENAEKLLKLEKDGYNGKAPAQGCVDQARKSYAACKAAPNETPEVEFGKGLKDQPDELKALALQGQTRNLEKAEQCKTEREKTEKACKEMDQAYDQAIKDDRATGGTMNQDLVHQKIANNNYKNAAETALEDYQSCWTDEATRMDWVANQSNTTSASAASDASTAAAQKGGAELNDHGFKEASKSYVRDKLSGFAAESGTEAAEKAAANGVVEGGEDAVQGAAKSVTSRLAGGAVNVATNMATGDGLGVATSIGETGAGFIKAIPGTLSSTAFGAVGFLLGSTEPAGGACSTFHADGLDADANGCVQSGYLATQALN